MNVSRILVISLILVTLHCCAVRAEAGKQPVQSQSLDEAAIRSLLATYVESVNAADTLLASTIWADSPDVSFIHPRGHERGWDAVKTQFYEGTMGQFFQDRKLVTKDLAIHCYGETAWAEFYWDFTAKMRADGRPIETHGRETQIYRRLNGEWRLVHVHYSGMPVTAEREGF